MIARSIAGVIHHTWALLISTVLCQFMPNVYLLILILTTPEHTAMRKDLFK